MRPIASDQSQTVLALNEVLGTKGQVRLLRVIATETNGSFASPEVATRAGMTLSGARKALRRLVAAGVVEKVGTGKATRYVLCREGKLADEIVRLFQLERESVDPGWARDPRPEPSPSPIPIRGTGAEETNGKHLSKPNGKVNPKSPEFHGALLSLLEEDLSLLKRAREKVMEKLENRLPGNGHDLWEWRKVFDTYPLPRLLHFLESESPRAVRLRQSSPFPEVMSERERERLGELIERPH